MDIQMSWSNGLGSKSFKEQSDALDREVERYSKWISNLSDSRVSGPLNNPERALIKTYLIQKLTGKLDEER